MKAFLKKIFFTISLFVLAITSQAQQPEQFLKASGSPANPKVPVSWNRYNDYAAITEICKKLAKAYPDLVKLESMGKSHLGKELWVMTISDLKKGDPGRKPAMYIDGNIHSNEIQGSEFALYTAWYLAESFADTKHIQNLLEDKTFYIAPTINPDARDNFIHKANNANSPRSGMIPVDNDRDGEINEDGFDDLDGDGHIGEYELLGYEGIDNDGDGDVNEDGEGFYDPNRDWAWNWQPNYIQSGAYKYPFSLPENRSISEFVMKHPNIAAGQSYHNNGGMILRGPGALEDLNTYNAQDVQVYDALGK